MHAFITVGSTRFDELVELVLTDSVLTALHRNGYTELVVQCGNSALEQPLAAQLVASQSASASISKAGVSIQLWRFKDSLADDYKSADLVISHAGSGTILDVLRLGKPLIVVPNPTLLDNHQQELALALETLGHLKSCTPQTLAATIDGFKSFSIVPFPAFEGDRFKHIVDEEMGFV